ncbi:MAG TPA: vitamin K epoxide reductase family protein [Polyangiaceae bacterium]|nr:vitamin K epoxide reductase family protein [Polyangiaceae bacterium]
MRERLSWAIRLALGFAVVGALVCIALEVVHVRGYLAPSVGSLCSFGARLDCNSVALSRYAVLLGVPLPFWGFAGFVALALAAWRRSGWLLPLAAVAALAGVGLTALAAFVIGAVCLLCEVVHALSVATLICAWRARPSLSRPLVAREESAWVLLPSLGVLLAAFGLVPRYWSVSEWKSDVPLAHGRTADGYPWVGAEQPRLVLEQFVDYSCPHCKAESAQTALRLAAHPNELRVVRRFFPRLMCTPPSEPRCLALRIALCADEQDRFWQADRWLFEHNEGGIDPSPAEAAAELGLDPERLAACLARPATFARAAAEWRTAKKLHVPGTPYYRLDGRLLTSAEAAQKIDGL